MQVLSDRLQSGKNQPVNSTYSCSGQDIKKIKTVVFCNDFYIIYCAVHGTDLFFDKEVSVSKLLLLYNI
jgi:hypothetical protein